MNFNPIAYVRYIIIAKNRNKKEKKSYGKRFKRILGELGKKTGFFFTFSLSSLMYILNNDSSWWDK